MKLAVTKTTKYSHNGYEVVEYVAGRTYDVDDQCAKTAVADKWGAPQEQKDDTPARKPVDPSRLNAEQLSALCVERGITVPEGASRKSLIALLGAKK